MARSLLIRGLIVGIVAGIVAFVVARIVGESAVAEAIGVEAAHAAHGEEEAEVVGRGVQAGIGLLTATVVYGIALGGIFSLVVAGALGRVRGVGVRGLAAGIALTGFVVVYAAPFVKYPPNPPAVGNPDTIGRRTALYFVMLLISLAVAGLAVWAARALRPALGGWNAAIASGVGYVVIMGLVIWALPVIQEVGPDFPATTLYHFRAASFAIQLSVWATLGLLFGAVAEPLVSREALRRSGEVPVVA